MLSTGNRFRDPEVLKTIMLLPTEAPEMCAGNLGLYTAWCCCPVSELDLTLLRPHGLQPAKLFCPCDFPGKNTGLGCHCHFLLQGIFLTQRSNPRLLHWKADSLSLNQWEGSFVIIQGKPVEDKPTSWDDDSGRTETLRLCKSYLVSLPRKTTYLFKDTRIIVNIY